MIRLSIREPLDLSSSFGLTGHMEPSIFNVLIPLDNSWGPVLRTVGQAFGLWNGCNLQIDNRSNTRSSVAHVRRGT